MWKDIPGFEGIYKINEDGDIINFKGEARSPYISNKGYKLIDLHYGNKRTRTTVHRLVAQTFIPNPSNLPVVLHKDNNKLNTNVSNLEWGSYSDNNRQAIQDGLNRVPKPDNRRCYELTNGIETIICYGCNEIANKTGITESMVRNYIFRNQPIKTGPFKGYYIKLAENMICPIYFPWR